MSIQCYLGPGVKDMTGEGGKTWFWLKQFSNLQISIHKSLLSPWCILKSYYQLTLKLE